MIIVKTNIKIIFIINMIINPKILKKIMKIIFYRKFQIH